MTTTEQRIAKAIHATAQQITADSIPPFQPSESTQPNVSRTWAGPRLWARMLVPAAAALSVAALATAALVIGNEIAEHRVAANSSHQARLPYYAKMTLEGPVSSHTPVEVTIRSTATGAVLATVPSPAARFVPRLVSAGADDRTFVLAATESGLAPSALAPVRFYSLQFDPATDAVSVNQLPISNVTVSTENVSLQIALSPDGQQLAVITSTFHGIRLYSLASGDQRTWTANPADELLAPAWAGGSLGLAYSYRPLGRSGSEPGVYLLDTESRRHSLLAASVWLSALEESGCSPPWFLPTPSVIVCAIAHRADHVTRAYIAEFAIGTGQLVRRIPLPGVVRNGVVPQIVWVDPTGTRVIVLTSDPRPPVLGAVAAFLVTGNQMIRIPEARWPAMLSANLLGAW